jgi:hypothetical protein
MAGPTLYSVFEYLATLISERDTDEPFLLSQIQPAISYKFPDFSFANYQLPGMKDFILSGEKAGYFKLVNTGDIKTAYLAPGTKTAQAATRITSTQEMAANDPRRTRWMTLTLEAMILAERGDQIVEAMEHVDALSPEFDAFMMAEGKAARLYPVRGKIQRLRDFLRTCREKGEAAALASWQISRTVLRMPTIPEVKTAAAAQSLIWALLQGNMALEKVSMESMDNLFFAVLAFSREQMTRNKSWDWVVALNILEAETRAIPRPAPPAQKRGLFGGKQQEPARSPFELDEDEIRSLTDLLRSTAGAEAGKADETPTWQAFVNTPNLETSYRFLVEHPKLIEDDKVLAWLEDQLGHNMASGKMDAVKNLANKSALVIAARQFGLQQMRQQSGEIGKIYESVLDGARQLGVLFGFLNAQSPQAAAQYFQQHNELADTDNIGPLIDDQTLKAVREDDLGRYRQFTERADLWRNLTEFGVEEGMRQHQGFLTTRRDDKTLQAEMGIMLLSETKSPDDIQEIMGRYPPVASKDALSMVTRMLDSLSFHGADPEEYNRYFEVKRLIERCLEVGVDRTLSELK